MGDHPKDAIHVEGLGAVSLAEKKSITHGDFWIPEEERELYKRALRALNAAGVPYVVAGAYAIFEHAGIYRDTKDLDLFVEPRNVVETVRVLREAGFTSRLEQPHWLAKVLDGPLFIDLIYGTGNGLSFIDADWYRHSKPAILAATPVRVAPAEELIWHRLFIGERHRHDMADIVHLLACKGAALDWDRLLLRVGEHWPLLLAQLQTFAYVYPESSGNVPRRVSEELLGRARADLDRPRTSERVTRGPLISRFSFAIDVNEWGYRDARADTVAAQEARPEVRAIVASDVWDERSGVVDEYLARHGAPA